MLNEVLFQKVVLFSKHAALLPTLPHDQVLLFELFKQYQISIYLRDGSLIKFKCSVLFGVYSCSSCLHWMEKTLTQTRYKDKKSWNMKWTIV